MFDNLFAMIGPSCSSILLVATLAALTALGMIRPARAPRRSLAPR